MVDAKDIMVDLYVFFVEDAMVEVGDVGIGEGVLGFVMAILGLFGG